MKQILIDAFDAMMELEEEHSDEEYGEEKTLDYYHDLQEAGYLTNDVGLVVTMQDNKKYIVTIKEV